MTAQKEVLHTGVWDLLLSVSMLVLLIVLMSPAGAAERYDDFDAVGTGQMLVRDGEGYSALLTQNSRFDVAVSGLVAQTRLQQTFHNDSNQWVEAVYVFPLPDNAAVNAMALRVGERIIRGQVKEKQQALKEYVQARAEGRRSGLVQQQRPNLFTTRVANIGPGEDVQVDITFVATLRYDNGELALRLPTTLTPRYIPGVRAATETRLQASGWAFATDQVPDAPDITPPQTRSVPENSHRADIHVQIDSGFAVATFESPFLPVTTREHGGVYDIEPAAGAMVMDHDFVLRWKPAQRQAPVAAAFHETVQGREHGLFMMLPPADEQALVIPSRELILVIDTSGSMAGGSIEQARAALSLALQQLRPQDAFNVIEFNSDYRQLFSTSVPASSEYLRQAENFVRSLNADGGTEMAGALSAALKQNGESRAVRQVVFITDGSVGNETSLFGLIQNNIGDSRLYTVGIGSAPNSYFMHKAAEFGRGTYTYIGSSAEVRSRMSALFAKIERPVVTHLQISFDGVAAETYLGKIPDLFSGEPLLVSARFQQWPQRMQVSGEFQGQPWHTELKLAAVPPRNPGIATLWAREKVAHLQDEGVRQGDAGRFRNDITQVGIEYQIVTPYTSFIAVEDTVARPDSETLKSQAVPNLMPQGSTQPAPGVGYPQTAAGIPQHLLFGFVTLLLALFAWVHFEFGREELSC